jgi:hypothetical protein
MKSETRNIENFDKINFKDFGTLVLSQGEHEALTIEASEELLAELESEVNNGTLTLGLAGDWFDRIGKAISTLLSSEDRKVTYHLTVVDLRKISISGQCKLTCTSLETEALQVNISGLSTMNFSQLDCDQLNLNISGRGEFSAAGRATEQTLKISGSGDIHTTELACERARISISGQGNATIRAEEELDITISGMGQINYYGRPRLRQTISGMGKAKRLPEKETTE